MLVTSIGRRQMGKTTLVMHMADKVRRRVVLDPRGLIRRPGAVVVHSAAALESAMAAMADDECEEVVYSPEETQLDDAFEAFVDQLRTWCLEHPKRTLAAVIDESSFFLDARDEVPDALLWTIKCCDPARLHIFLTCHRPSELPVIIRGLANRSCFFRTTQEHDLEAVRRHCRKDVVDLVQALGDREFVEWNDDDGTFRVHRHPAVWFTELKPRGASRAIVEWR